MSVGFPLVALSKDYSPLSCSVFSLQCLFLLRSAGFTSYACGLSSCGSLALGHSCHSWRHMGLASLRHVGSSRTRD